MPESPAVNLPPADTADERRATAGGVQLLLLLAGSCMSVLGAVLIAPVLPQLSLAFAGTPGAGVLVPVVLTAPLAGVVADRIDRKRLLLLVMPAYTGSGPRRSTWTRSARSSPAACSPGCARAPS
ncbi:hypothetical protein [Amycolatopsis australiensis]|uniref:hypothetical protein n=1 Tax=Amycolatopsis australiensis TaxID=546364 RepID=UPI001FE5C5F2|nr:hypothetical protein [Amycolatopsis australiensis]